LTRDVFITGGTGYIGRSLTAALLARGHRVRVLARAASASRVPSGASAVIGNALDARSFACELSPSDTVVHLVGTPHPSPAKAAEFRAVDLPSIEASVAASSAAGVAHLVYLSVAHPAPIMKAYIAARSAGEAAISRAGLTATVMRPWYVLGPRHWWPGALIPLYALLERLPSTRAQARRLGLVTIRQMVDALVRAVESPPPRGTVRIVEVPEIRNPRKEGWQT
jgi:nucleoside-diphosphate-sugar epimerase